MLVSENMDKNRTSLKNTKWKTELMDTGYRHQFEKGMSKKCPVRQI